MKKEITIPVYNKDYQVFDVTNDPENKYKIIINILKDIIKDMSEQQQHCAECKQSSYRHENINHVTISIELSPKWRCDKCGARNEN